jgi:hypothetical protein
MFLKRITLMDNDRYTIIFIIGTHYLLKYSPEVIDANSAEKGR